MTAEVGLPAAEAIVAHAEGRHGDVVSTPHAHPPVVPSVRWVPRPARRLQRTLVDSAVRAGRPTWRLRCSANA